MDKHNVEAIHNSIRYDDGNEKRCGKWVRKDVVIVSILVYQKTLFLDLLLEFVVGVEKKLVILINAYLKRREIRMNDKNVWIGE